MESEEPNAVHSVQLNPAILENVRRRVYDSLEFVLVDSLYVFFSKMFLKAADDASINPDELNPLNVFIDRLDMIPLWGEEIIEKTCEAIKDHAEKKFKFFNLKKFLKRILSTQLCQAAALENQACSSKIQLNDVHVQEFTYNLLKLSAPHVANAPQLFTPNRGKDYVKREQSLELFFCRAIQRALSQFIELFIWRIGQGEIDSPYVDIPKRAIEGPSEERVEFKDIDVNDTVGGRLSENTEPDNSNLGMESFGENKGGEEEEEEEEEEEAAGIDFDDDAEEQPKDDNRPWGINEGPRGRYNEEDNLENDERRNPRRLSFNEEVDVQPFQRENVKSILRRNDPSRVYKTEPES